MLLWSLSVVVDVVVIDIVVVDVVVVVKVAVVDVVVSSLEIFAANFLFVCLHSIRLQTKLSFLVTRVYPIC
jgi:hypothetical protein